MNLHGSEVVCSMKRAVCIVGMCLRFYPQLTSATKVAFLNQVSVLITPLLVHLSGERVRGIEWLACGMGLLGSILVAADSLMNGGGGGHGGHGGMAADGPGNEVSASACVRNVQQAIDSWHCFEHLMGTHEDCVFSLCMSSVPAASWF